MDISFAIDAFLLDCQTRGLRPASLTAYGRQLRLFHSWCDSVAVVTLDQVDPITIRRYIIHLQIKALRPASIRSAGRVLRVWLSFCAREELLDASPMKTVRLPQAPRPKPDAFTRDELRALHAAAQSDPENAQRATAIFLCLLDTGARIGEFSQLRRGDVDLDAGAVTLRSETTKNRMQRVTFIGEAARAALADYLATLPPMAAADPLWQGRQGPLTVDGMHNLIYRIGRRAGVQPCGAHKYRRTFATVALHGGMDAKTTASIMGHSVDELLRSYVHSDDDALRAAHALHGPVDKLLK